MAINDITGSASWMSPKGNGANAQGVVVSTRNEIDDLVKYMESAQIASQKKVQKSWMSSAQERSKWTQRDLDAFVQQNLKATKLIDNAWKKTKLGGFLGQVKDYQKAFKELNSGKIDMKAFSAKAGGAAQAIGSAVGDAVKKAVDFVVKKYADYAKSYEKYLPTTSTNLGTNRSGYSSLLQSTNKEVFSQGLGGTVSMKDVMASMDQLAQSGISSNLEQLSILKSMESRISTTFDSSSIMDQMRRRGNDSGIYQLSLGEESMLRDVLQEQFGNSQYISNGMFKQTKIMVDAMLATASSSEKSIEIEYAMQESLGELYSLGLSQAGISDAQVMLKKLSEGDVSGLSPGQLKAVMDAGGITQFMGKDVSSESIKNLLGSYGNLYNEFQTDNRLVGNALVNGWGVGATSDYMNGLDMSEFTKEVTDAGSIDKYFQQQETDAKKRQTFESGVNKYLDNIVGLLGGNSLSQLGSGIISKVGGGISSALSAVAGIGVTSVLGKKMLGGLGGGATKLLGGTSLSSGGGIRAGASKLLSSTGAKVLGGVGGGIAALADGMGAVNSKAYSDNGVLNFLGGAVMGNQSGDQSFGGYAKSIGGNAMKGAAIGTIFGPVGTAIGAGVGALFGGIGNLISGKKKEADAAAQQQTQEVGAATTTSTSDSISILNTINQSINVQTDKLVAALTNLYKLIQSGGGSSQPVLAGDYIK